MTGPRRGPAPRDLLGIDDALRLVEGHGVVLEAAAGPVATLVHEIVGEPVRGSWWGHPDSHHVHAVTRAVRDSPNVLVCRLVRGKITYVHRRLWPALLVLAEELDPARLAAVLEEHTPEGRHRTVTTPFPEWADEDTVARAAHLDEATARRGLAAVLGGGPGS